MPLTFLSHQAPVLPLKMLWPRWFDGTALVVGSMAPDLLYFTYGSPIYVYAHDLSTQVWLCVPVTILLTWMLKRVIAGPLASHLPDLGAWHLRDFGRLSVWRVPTSSRRWFVLLVGALVGSLSHLVLDSFTHSFGWTVERVEALQAEIMVPTLSGGRALPVYDALQLGGSVVGAFVVAWCVLLIGRGRSLVSWYPTAPALARATRASWLALIGSVGAGAIAGIIVGSMTGFTPGAPASIIRAAGCTFLGLFVGCAWAGRLMDPPVTTVDGVEIEDEEREAALSEHGGSRRRGAPVEHAFRAACHHWAVGAGGLTSRQRVGLGVAGVAFVVGVLLAIVPFSSGIAVPSGATIDVSCRAPVLEIYRVHWVTSEIVSTTTLTPAQVAALGDAYFDRTAACRLRSGTRLVAGATLIWLAAVIVTVTIVNRRRAERRPLVRGALWVSGFAAIAFSLALTWVPFVERFPSADVLLRCRGPMVVVSRATPIVDATQPPSHDHGAASDAANGTMLVVDGTNRQCEVNASRRIEVGGLVYWVGTYVVAALLFTRRRA